MNEVVGLWDYLVEAKNVVVLLWIILGLVLILGIIWVKYSRDTYTTQV